MSQQHSKAQMLKLYRHIIRNAKVFPSVKRDAMVQDIRIEVRQAAHTQNTKNLFLVTQPTA
jgi:Complex 1 protein (LYR family)